MASLREDLVQKLKTLADSLWGDVVDWPMVLEWLDNFAEDAPGVLSERLHALFLLSQFMYFGGREMRELLKSLFRDLYRYPIVEHLRRANHDTVDAGLLQGLFAAELDRTRFLGVGNPSESGTHLLYYFRQQNGLHSELFINTHEIFQRIGAPTTLSLRAPDVTRYVFVDDFCGSGTQAIDYSTGLVADIKRLSPRVRVAYYVLFATAQGLANVRGRTQFDDVNAVFELDDSFRCFGASSRYFRLPSPELQKAFAEQMTRTHGSHLFPAWPLGYRDGQLLIGFYHNVPDNTLPIIWRSRDDAVSWVPIFRRYPKLYEWGGV